MGSNYNNDRSSGHYKKNKMGAVVFLHIVYDHINWCSDRNNNRWIYVVAFNQVPCFIYTMVLAANKYLQLTARLRLTATEVSR